MSKHEIFWVYGDNVNTDVIFPGKYTYTLKTPDEIAAHALEDLDPSFAGRAQPGDVIVAGCNWGCGSSREQGVTALKYAGVRAIIAHRSAGCTRNCINQGVLPVIVTGLRALVHSGDEIELDVENAVLRVGDQTFTFARLSPSVQAILDAGGLLPMLQRQFSAQEMA